MEIAAVHQGSYEAGGDAMFTGRVWMSPGLSSADGTRMIVVQFSAGARTHWHSHPGGQLLFGVSGRGWVRSRGGRGHVLVPGDIVHIPPGEWHYHGGGPDSPMAHVSVSMGGPAEWGDPVSDQDYAEEFPG